jgi:hypothetical protein
MIQLAPTEPPAPDAGADASPAAPRPARGWRESRLLLESALIVLSVLLGVALSEWQESRREHARARAALANFRREIATNLARLEHVQPVHRALAARLDSVAKAPGQGAAFDAFVTVMPKEGLQIEPLADAAWETASSTGVLRLLEYEISSALSETYLIQRQSIGGTVNRLSDRFIAPQNFDPASRTPMLRTHQMLFIELSGQESYLVDVYRRMLTKLGPAPE